LNRPGNAIFSDVDRGGVDIGFFQVIDDFVTALDTDNQTDINRALSEIDSLTDSMTTSIVDIGARQRTVELQQEIIADTKLRYELLVNAETELDYTSAITELTAEMLSLEAAQASFAKISQLSLFDYIR
jgi:flagellar hook-associated protein 3 FlgL